MQQTSAKKVFITVFLRLPTTRMLPPAPWEAGGLGQGDGGAGHRDGYATPRPPVPGGATGQRPHSRQPRGPPDAAAHHPFRCRPAGRFGVVVGPFWTIFLRLRFHRLNSDLPSRMFFVTVRRCGKQFNKFAWDLSHQELVSQS